MQQTSAITERRTWRFADPTSGAGLRVARQPRESAKSILLVEADPELCALMSGFFAGHGFRIHAEHDGRRGLTAALDGGFDLVILDVMLPGLDGLEALHRLRQRSAVPVIIMTARTAPEDRIAGLNAGADDYLPKPLEPDELLARIRAILRRSGAWPWANASSLEIGGLRLDPATRQLWRNHIPVEVTAAEFDVLEVLMRAAGRVVSRDELAAALYQREATPFERSLDVHVCHLRKKLAEGSRGLIRTVRGVGYLFSPGPELLA